MSVCPCGRKITATDRAYSGPCADCGTPTCPKHTFFYTDEANIAITSRARPKCIYHRETP